MQLFKYDETQNLRKNTFTRVGYTFGYWKKCGVQLWENGPYFAETNIGATSPEDYGYYFWWGDTVGYTYDGSRWVASDGSGSTITFDDSSPANTTSNKDNTTLLADGVIDGSGNLTSAYDAATAHLGTPWRMPTSAEWDALLSNCDTTWTTQNGVNGRLITGKGDYSENSIFLPAAGYVADSSLYHAGSFGFYQSSTPYSGYSIYAWYLSFDSSDIGLGNWGCFRCLGQSVRPVRDFA